MTRRKTDGLDVGPLEANVGKKGPKQQRTSARSWPVGTGSLLTLNIEWATSPTRVIYTSYLPR